MHVISESRLKEFWEKYPDAKTSLRSWYKKATIAQWSNLAEVKAVFSSADIVGNFTVFNIRGNKLCCIQIAYGIREGEGEKGRGGEDLTIFDRDSKYTI